MMDELVPAPRNRVLGGISDALRSGREGIQRGLNIPLALPFGLGTTRRAGDVVSSALIGKMPEELDAWSYGDSPLEFGTARGSKPLVGVKEGRGEGLFDTAMGALDATGVAGAIGRGVKYGGKAALSRGLRTMEKPAMDEGRREALKTIGKGVAVAGAATTAPALVSKALRTGEGVADLAKAVPPGSGAAARVATWTPEALRAAAREVLQNYTGLDDAVDVSEDMLKHVSGRFADPDRFRNFQDFMNKHWDEVSPDDDDLLNNKLYDMDQGQLVDMIETGEIQKLIDEGYDPSQIAYRVRPIFGRTAPYDNMNWEFELAENYDTAVNAARYPYGIDSALQGPPAPKR